jgi:hypothetical protein
VPSAESVVVLVVVLVVVMGGYLATYVGLWKVFNELFKDSRRRGWFK